MSALGEEAHPFASLASSGDGSILGTGLWWVSLTRIMESRGIRFLASDRALNLNPMSLQVWGRPCLVPRFGRS